MLPNKKDQLYNYRELSVDQKKSIDGAKNELIQSRSKDALEEFIEHSKKVLTDAWNLVLSPEAKEVHEQKLNRIRELRTLIAEMQKKEIDEIKEMFQKII